MITNNWCVVCHVKLLISRGWNENKNSECLLSETDGGYLATAKKLLMSNRKETPNFRLFNWNSSWITSTSLNFDRHQKSPGDKSISLHIQLDFFMVNGDWSAMLDRLIKNKSSDTFTATMQNLIHHWSERGFIFVRSEWRKQTCEKSDHEWQQQWKLVFSSPLRKQQLI